MLKTLELLALAVPLCALTLPTLAAPTTNPPVTARKMSDAANAFLKTLEPAKREQAVLNFNDENRLQWYYIPTQDVPGGKRKGLSLGEMSEAQQKAALDLLRVGLSEKGYKKADMIRQLEPVLRAIENGNPNRDPSRYFFTVFGTPSSEGTWGWRYEGHHCSQNWTIVQGKAIATSPQFFGSNPAEVMDGPLKGTRVLGAEEDLGRSLVQSLTEAQKKEAVLSDIAPGDIITGSKRQVAILEDKGVAYKDLDTHQQGILLALIEEHASAQPPELAQERLAKIRQAGLDNVKFAWMGGLEKGQGHYYRIQGSTFLIEYDNTQNHANHVHEVWRDFKGDFGVDLLNLHYQEFPHDKPAAK
ncbi:MAG: DUF3500 domain-containing protein [Abitibacteriaceae bacterium]|nr:DUF3500 domain-containing protein [Abditibacteriaceae bacterium]